MGDVDPENPVENPEEAQEPAKPEGEAESAETKEPPKPAPKFGKPAGTTGFNKTSMGSSLNKPKVAQPTSSQPEAPQVEEAPGIPDPFEIRDENGKNFEILYKLYSKTKGTINEDEFSYADYCHTPLELLNIIDLGYQKFIPAKDLTFKFAEPKKAIGAGIKKEADDKKKGTAIGGKFGQGNALNISKEVKIEFKPGTVNFPQHGLNRVETSSKYFIPSAHILQTNQQILGLAETVKPKESETATKDYSSVFEPKLPELSAPVDIAPLAPITIGRRNLLGSIREPFDHGEIKYQYSKAHNNIHISRGRIGTVDLMLGDEAAKRADLDLSGVVMDPCSFDLGGLAAPALITMYGAWPADATGVRARAWGAVAEEFERTLVEFANKLGGFVSYREDTGALTFMVRGDVRGRITLPEAPVAF